MDANRFKTNSLQDARILRILSAAISAVDPFCAVQKNLPDIEGRVFGLGIGKAALPMMDALVSRIPIVAGLAVAKFASHDGAGRYAVVEAGHPVPDERSLRAGELVLDFISRLEEEDTLVCLISGGGSSLVTAPYVPLEDLQALTSLLLSCSAAIDEINVLRRRLDRLKGGGLAAATKAEIVSLILSDVIGNPPEAIASGPTAPDPTDTEDTLAILRKYGIDTQVPESISQFLVSGGALPETRLEAIRFRDVRNIVIGDNGIAAMAGSRQAESEGFDAGIYTLGLQGEAREAGLDLARVLRAKSMVKDRPFCLIAGGETTVTIRGDGKGGRNQELALACVDELSGVKDVMMVALATDGDDGPTDAAGAVVTGESARRAESLGMNAASHLARNDAYHFFEALGDLLATGPTGTNVNDLVFLFGL